MATNTHSVNLKASLSQYLQAADSASLSLTGDFTIQYWYKPGALPATNTIAVNIAKWAASGSYSYFVAIREDAGAGYYIYLGVSPNGSDSFTAQKAYAFSVDTWYHITVTFTTSTGVAEFFVNGTSIGTASTGNTSGVYNGTAPLTIGQMQGLYFSDHKLDDIRIFGRKVGSTEIADYYDRQLVGDETNLAAYYQLNNSYLDLTANNNDLTPVATVTLYDSGANYNDNFPAGYKAAQGFKVPAGTIITGFSIKGSKGDTTPATTFTAKIYEGGVTPDAGTELASQTYSTDDLGAYTASPSYHDFTFTTPTGAVTGGSTQYYLVLIPNDGTGADVIRFNVDQTSPTYADGTAWRWTSGTWTEGTGTDHDFKIYGTLFSTDVPFTGSIEYQETVESSIAGGASLLKQGLKNIMASTAGRIIFRLLDPRFENCETGSMPLSFDHAAVNYGTGAVTLDTTSKVRGVKSLRFSNTGEASMDARWDLRTDQKEIYIQLVGFIPSGFSFGAPGYAGFLVVRNSADDDVFLINIEDWGSVKLSIQYAGSGYAAMLNLPTNTPFKLELRLKVSTTDGRIQAWLNNLVEASPTYDSGVINTGSAAFQKIYFGKFYVEATTSDYWMDNFRISYQFIGAASYTKLMFSAIVASVKALKTIQKNAFSVGIAGTASLLKAVGKNITSIIKAQGIIIKQSAREIIAIVVASAILNTQKTRLIRAFVNASASVIKHVSNTQEATIAAASVVNKTIGKTLRVVLKAIASVKDDRFYTEELKAIAKASVTLTKQVAKEIAAIVKSPATVLAERIVFLTARIVARASVRKGLISKTIRASAIISAIIKLSFWKTKYTHQNDVYSGTKYEHQDDDYTKKY